ncbi:MAG: hypothetical protein LVR00_04710 [Rhabdochlamydiaceae bacterium]|jgi:hypothetical protein
MSPLLNPLLQHTPIVSLDPKTAAVIPLDVVKKALKILEPLPSYDRSGNRGNLAQGKKLLSQGKIGCLILAGGQGTRLSSKTAKALTPVTLVTHKSLLQLFCEKHSLPHEKAIAPSSCHHDLASQSPRDQNFLRREPFFWTRHFPSLSFPPRNAPLAG